MLQQTSPGTVERGGNSIWHPHPRLNKPAPIQPSTLFLCLSSCPLYTRYILLFVYVSFFSLFLFFCSLYLSSSSILVSRYICCICISLYFYHLPRSFLLFFMYIYIYIYIYTHTVLLVPFPAWWQRLSLSVAQIKFSSTVKQCQYPSRNNPLLPVQLPPSLQFTCTVGNVATLHDCNPLFSIEKTRMPLVSGSTDRTRIDRINYSLLTISTN